MILDPNRKKMSTRGNSTMNITSADKTASYATKNVRVWCGSMEIRLTKIK